MNTTLSREQRDADHIAHQDRWTHWPVLTMIRLADRLPGVLWGPLPVVYHVNLYALTGGTFDQVLGGKPSTTYTSIAELVAEWRVD